MLVLRLLVVRSGRGLFASNFLRRTHAAGDRGSDVLTAKTENGAPAHARAYQFFIVRIVRKSENGIFEKNNALVSDMQAIRKSELSESKSKPKRGLASGLVKIREAATHPGSWTCPRRLMFCKASMTARARPSWPAGSGCSTIWTPPDLDPAPDVLFSCNWRPALATACDYVVWMDAEFKNSRICGAKSNPDLAARNEGVSQIANIRGLTA